MLQLAWHIDLAVTAFCEQPYHRFDSVNSSIRDSWFACLAATLAESMFYKNPG